VATDMMPIIPYSRQSIDEDDIAAVVEVLRSEFLTQGPKIAQFEQALADYCGAAHAVVFSSGTAALHAAHFAAGVGPGDEVVTSPLTFAATANAALYLGARPVFADVEPDTGNIDPERIAAAITPRTRALAPVHFAGHPVDLDRIGVLAARHGLVVIEDACHALGARHRGRRIGVISEMTVFSFHPVKTIATGEGGAVLTASRELGEKLRLFRSHGITREALTLPSEGAWYYEMQALGMNYRLTDIQAALGISQLRKADAFVARRAALARRYREALADHPGFDLPGQRGYADPAHHLFPILLASAWVGRKREIFDALRSRGVGVQCHYLPVYRHPYYRALGYPGGLCPAAEEFSRREISLPLYPALKEEEQEYVVRVLGEVFGGRYDQ
jgi:UDP-4-amino-4,6-dideoxy-N-acetyl-beta-L-altrosamine transaminase